MAFTLSHYEVEALRPFIELERLLVPLDEATIAAILEVAPRAREYWHERQDGSYERGAILTAARYLVPRRFGKQTGRE